MSEIVEDTSDQEREEGEGGLRNGDAKCENQTVFGMEGRST